MSEPTLVFLPSPLQRFMLVNLDRRRVLSSMSPTLSSGSVSSSSSGDSSVNGAGAQQLNVGRKLDIMRTFYRNTVGPVFQDAFIPSPHAIDHNGGEQKDIFIACGGK